MGSRCLLLLSKSTVNVVRQEEERLNWLSACVDGSEPPIVVVCLVELFELG